ncbi:hypothetical protein [Nocardia farcinica]|uniref:hypothetical protein n=1 Tax=Nocardia farcinica TaxID=37329 RepID=UPI00245481CA|nr:hypothetical protein [Nocardia farcinica]
MSDRSVEDEIVSEISRFSVAMRAAISRHAQAANWLERRRARKEISRLVRTERREADQARTHHKTWTAQAVERYRVHAQAVAQRASDPTVDHTRRARDAWSLAEHRADLARMFVTNGHLTRTEQGIALDGLDAATAFPEHKDKVATLFAKAHKVKGIEALRYRAQVARAQQQLGIDRTEVVHRGAGHVAAQRAQRQAVEQQYLAGSAARLSGEHQVEAGRFRAVVGWTDRNGVTTSRSKSFDSEQAATAWMRSNPDRMLTFGTAVHVQTWDSRDDRAPIFSSSGGHQAVMASLAEREQALVQRDEQVVAGREQLREPERLTRDQEDAIQGLHRAQREWELRPADADPRQTEALTARWREAGRAADRAGLSPERIDRELAVAHLAVERDRLRDELESMRQRHHLSIEHNGELSDRNDQLTRQLTAVLAERDQLAAARDQAVAERDRLRGERDEAVHKLVERTPAAQRYGSPERQAEQAKRPSMAEAVRHKAAAREEVLGRAAQFEAAEDLERQDRLYEDPNLSPEALHEADEKLAAAASWSPLAAHQPGHSLAESVARNGRDREGMER